MDKKEIEKRLLEGRLVNWYETKIMKDYVSPIDDSEYKKYLGMSMGDHILMVGKTKSGKSLSFLSYLYTCQNLLPKTKPFYKKIYILAKKKEGLTDMIKDKLGEEFVEIHYTVNTFPRVESFDDLSKKNKDKYLVIIDDYVNDKKGNTLKVIQDYFTFGRNKGINLLFLSQSFFQTDIFIRKQCSYICLCGIAGENDLKRILADFKSKNVDYNTLENMYKFCKNYFQENEPSFLKIYTQQCSENDRYTLNFTIPLKPKDFQNMNFNNEDEND